MNTDTIFIALTGYRAIADVHAKRLNDVFNALNRRANDTLSHAHLSNLDWANLRTQLETRVLLREIAKA